MNILLLGDIHYDSQIFMLRFEDVISERPVTDNSLGFRPRNNNSIPKIVAGKGEIKLEKLIDSTIKYLSINSTRQIPEDFLRQAIKIALEGIAYTQENRVSLRTLNLPLRLFYKIKKILVLSILKIIIQLRKIKFDLACSIFIMNIYNHYNYSIDNLHECESEIKRRTFNA